MGVRELCLAILFVAPVLVAPGCRSAANGAGLPSEVTPPQECLTDVPCVDPIDCAGEPGTRCNLAMDEPMCQEIRCGTVGSQCSEDALCASGLECLGRACRDDMEFLSGGLGETIGLRFDLVEVTHFLESGTLQIDYSIDDEAVISVTVHRAPLGPYR